jgi:hypothetical protein
LRETYYVTRSCCSWPLPLLPLVQGTSRTPTTTAWGAKTEDLSDDLNFKIGDLLSRPLSLAPRAPAAARARYAHAPLAACCRARPLRTRARCCLRTRSRSRSARAPVHVLEFVASAAACAPVAHTRPLRSRDRCCLRARFRARPLLPARPFPRLFRARAR